MNILILEPSSTCNDTKTAAMSSTVSNVAVTLYSMAPNR